MDWGTTIVDAGGSFHDIAKDAFDGIHKRLKGPINSTLPLLQDDFKKTYSNLMAKTREALGLSPEDSLSVENMQAQITTKIKHTIARLSVEAIADAALQAATGLEGPIGLILAEAVNFGVEAFTKYMESGYTFDHGEWVFIDMGEKPRRQDDQPIIQVKAESNFFSHEAFFEIPDEIEYAMVPHHSVGFIMGSAKGSGMWVVFNFETGKEEERDVKELRPCPAQLKTKLDASEDFSVVREVKFLKDHDPTLKSYLPTESGQVVIFRKQPHTIIEVTGDRYLLETKSGKRVEVSASQLEGGRTENTASWDHSRVHLGSFTSKSTDTVFIGEWIWVAAENFRRDIRANMGRRRLTVPAIANEVDPKDRVLALVDFVKDTTVHYTRAYDGVQTTSTVNQVYGVKDDIARILNSNKAAKKFKSSVLHNNDVQDNPLGEALPMLTLGKGPPGTTDPQEMKPHMKFDRATKYPTRPSLQMAGMTETIVAEYQTRQDDEFYGDDRVYDRYEIIPGVDKSGSGSGFTIIVAALALVAFVMMS